MNRSLNPSFGITKNQTVLVNKLSGCVFLAGRVDEETQCQGENRDHVSPIGDLSHKAPDAAELIRKLRDEILHGDDEHRKWLSDKCEDFIERNCL